MNAEILYQVYETTRANGFKDLTFGLAKFKADHPEVQITQEEDLAMRQFMGRHGQELAAAFPDREKFQTAVEAGQDADDLAAEAVRAEDRE